MAISSPPTFLARVESWTALVAPAAFLPVLGCLAAIPVFGTAVVLPAVAQMAQGLHASPLESGLTVTLMTLGNGIAQVVAGPISDRFGRRPMAIVAAILFSFSSLACTLSPDIVGLLIMRLAAGFSAGACMVVSYAVLRDRRAGAAGRVGMSHINTAMWIMPIASSLIGGFLVTHLGWRANFGVLVVGGLLLLGSVLMALPETLDLAKRQPITLAGVAKNFVGILRHPTARGYAIIVGLCIGCSFAAIGSPFVFMDALGMSARVYGAIFAIILVGMPCGGFLSARLAARGVSTIKLVRSAIAFLAIANLGLLLFAIFDGITVVRLAFFIFAIFAAIGLAVPNAAHGVIEPFPAMAGTAASIVGVSHFLVGASGGSALAAFFYRGTPLGMIAVMAALSTGAALVWLFQIEPAASMRPVRKAMTRLFRVPNPMLELDEVYLAGAKDLMELDRRVRELGTRNKQEY
jgi:DHA1 family bicyclomycin/chloramphenicol resistance-like MFS transporter